MFHDWGDSEAAAVLSAVVDTVEPYVPGEFFKRELPCILALLAQLEGTVSVIVVDSYVDLGPERPGLGRQLWEEVDGRVAVVGVAKSRFEGAVAQEVMRGDSRKPLYVTAAGLTADDAARFIRTMVGRFRVPDLLKLADRTARDLAGQSEG